MVVEESHLDVISSSGSTWQPCFVVFDVLLINDTSDLFSRPFRQRYTYLEKILVGNDPGRIQILPHVSVNTKDDVMKVLEVCMAKNEEGLILKDPDSPYKFQAREDDWMKLKPEFLESYQEDVDVIIVGGYYGNGYRGGKLASFLCAVRDDSSSFPRYISFCKFGGGFSLEDLPHISLEDKGHWERFDAKSPPDWLDLPVSKDFPDMILKPIHSHIVSVRGSQLVQSTAFPTGITVRFPRFIKLRSHEKSIEECMTKTELADFLQRNKGAMQVLPSESNGNANLPSRKKRKISSRSSQVLDAFVGVDKSSVENLDSLFEGIEFSVFQKSTAVRSKEELERLIFAHGGSVAQTPTANTRMIIADDQSSDF